MTINFPISYQFRHLTKENMNAMQGLGILCGLEHSKYIKVMQCTYAKEMCDRALKNIYEGDEKVKKEKLQTYLG